MIIDKILNSESSSTEEEIVISLKKVSKCYKRYARPVDRLTEMVLPGKSKAQEFWALQDINLKVAKGETLGIIGRNGSGKSTLLQIIARTVTPTTGEVQVNGRVSALLELGSGFNPEFTGRQNVFLNGRLLGLSQEQIEEKFDEIAAFADIGDFLDEPVKTYSSGMFVRLAFAVAAHCNPQIFIVDEALAVGDIFFQQKCYKFLEDLRATGTAILFVSHDIQAILQLCDRAAILQNGHLTHSGTPADMVSKYTELYHSQFINNENTLLKTSPIEKTTKQLAIFQKFSDDLLTSQNFVDEFPKSNRYGCAIGLIGGISLTGEDSVAKSVFRINEEMTLSILLNEHQLEYCPLNIGFQLKDRIGQMLVGTNTYMLSADISESTFAKAFICQFKFSLNIYPQQYTLDIAVAEHKQDAGIVYDWIVNAAVIDVIADGKITQHGLYFPEITVKTI